MLEFSNAPWIVRRFDECQTAILSPVTDKSHPLVCIVSTGEFSPHGEANTSLILESPIMYGLLNNFSRYCRQWQQENGPFSAGDGRILLARHTDIVLSRMEGK